MEHVINIPSGSHVLRICEALCGISLDVLQCYRVIHKDYHPIHMSSPLNQLYRSVYLCPYTSKASINKYNLFEKPKNPAVEKCSRRTMQIRPSLQGDVNGFNGKYMAHC